MSTWFWIASRREREIIVKSIDHLNHVKMVVQHFHDLLLSIKQKDSDKFREEYSKVDLIEKEADVIKKNIIHELSKGLFHPLDREDLLKLIIESDDIAAYVKAAARKLNILISSGFTIPDKIMDKLIEISDVLNKAVNTLLEAVSELRHSIDKTINLSHIVEEYEEKIDDLRLESLVLLRSIIGDKLSFDYLLIKEIIDDLEMSSDRCEDVADTLRMIAVSHS